jgi:riboflavin-specific deaminase-like protein
VSEPVLFRRLVPPGDPVTAAGALADLELRSPDDRRPYVCLNMVTSIDGHARIDGRSGGLSSQGDRELFHRLRSLPDAVMAGAGTVRTERYGRPVRDAELVAARVARGLAPQPLMVIPSNSLRLDPELPLLADRESRVVILTSGSGELPPCAAEVDYVRAVGIAQQLEELRRRLEIGSIVCEGGPTLNAALLADALVDELFVSISPLLVGSLDSLTLVKGPAPPVELELVGLLESASHLHARYAVRRG